MAPRQQRSQGTKIKAQIISKWTTTVVSICDMLTIVVISSHGFAVRLIILALSRDLIPKKVKKLTMFYYVVNIYLSCPGLTSNQSWHHRQLKHYETQYDKAVRSCEERSLIESQIMLCWISIQFRAWH